MIKIGVLREGKAPPDKRVPFTPEQCKFINVSVTGVEVIVQPSPHRCFSDNEYKSLGIRVDEDLSGCNILMGVKEVNIPDLIYGKTYLFFSHTIKKQPYNRELLKALVKADIRMVDYEALTDGNGNRIIGFGRFAGVVGAYNGIRALGLKRGLYNLKPAYFCRDMEEMVAELSTVTIPPITIAVTGGGRVAGGVVELFQRIGLESVDPERFVQLGKIDKPLYVRLDPSDYNRHSHGKPFDYSHFYSRPDEYEGTFHRFFPATDLLIGAAYWDPSAPVLFTLDDTRRDDFRISVIADITCDIDGSIPTTRRATSIDDPFYDYDPMTNQLDKAFSRPNNITVMAVDNLPCELPVDASFDFGRNLIDKVLNPLLGNDPDDIIGRATITCDGKLNGRFSYLQDFLDGVE